MGIGPVPAIQAVPEAAGLKVADIDRVEINEAFGAQAMACARVLGLDEAALNVNGGAIAIGHPLGATGVRLTVTVARELARAGLRYGVASACIGGGQGIAISSSETSKPVILDRRAPLKARSRVGDPAQVVAEGVDPRGQLCPSDDCCAGSPTLVRLPHFGRG